MNKCHAKAGDTVLVNGAAGAVGSVVVQIARSKVQMFVTSHWWIQGRRVKESDLPSRSNYCHFHVVFGKKMPKFLADTPS